MVRWGVRWRGWGGEWKGQWGTRVELRVLTSHSPHRCVQPHIGPPTVQPLGREILHKGWELQVFGARNAQHSLHCRHSQFPQTHASLGPTMILGAVTPQGTALPLPRPSSPAGSG